MGKGFNPFGGKGRAGPQIDASRTDFRQDVLDRTKDSRENSLKLLADLQAQAQGQGPSIGTEALKQASKRSLAQTLAAASAQRGPGTAARKRQLVSQAGAGERNVAEQGSIVRAQEQQNAQQQLAALSEAQQAEDLQQIMQPGSIVASAESKRLEDAVKKAAEDSKRYGAEGAALVGAIGTVAGGVIGGVFGGPAGAAGGAALGGAIGSGVGGAAGEAVSDKRMKKDIQSAKKPVESFLDALEAKKYAYKDDSMPGTAPGERIGILAQDLEKSPMGRTLVKNTPQGKTVDTVQGFGAVLAAQAELHKRLKKLEKKG